MQRKEIFEKLKKDIEPRVEYNYKKTTKGVSIMKRTNEVSEKQILKQILNRLNEFEKNQLEFNNKQEEFNKNQLEFNKNQETFNKSQLEFNKAIMQRLDNIVTKNNLSE
ncbi:MAG: hypothetical protein DSZ21_02205 [Tenericutes bacterium]|nr:MAG: hypothetical protein DSZ21_02205 [Mycoplasmatota bacterium]